MSSSANTYVTLIYHSGRHFVGSNGIQFEGKTKMMKITRGTTYHELKRRIHQKLGLHASQSIIRLISRVETVVGKDNVHYVSNDICDDEDVDCVIGAFDARKLQNFIEIYVEFDCGGTSSEPMASPHYFGQEDRAVELSAPAQVLSQITVREGEDDEEEDHIDSDEEGEPESVIPLGDTSDTDVDGDFDADTREEFCSPAMPPFHVDPVTSGKLVKLSCM